MTVLKNAFNPDGKYQDMRASDFQDVSANRCELALSKRCPRPRSGSVLGPTDCQPILCGEVGAFRLWLSLGPFVGPTLSTRSTRHRGRQRAGGRPAPRPRRGRMSYDSSAGISAAQPHEPDASVHSSGSQGAALRNEPWSSTQRTVLPPLSSGPGPPRVHRHISRHHACMSFLSQTTMEDLGDDQVITIDWYVRTSPRRLSASCVSASPDLLPCPLSLTLVLGQRWMAVSHVFANAAQAQIHPPLVSVRRGQRIAQEGLCLPGSEPPRVFRRCRPRPLASVALQALRRRVWARPHDLLVAPFVDSNRRGA